MFKKRVVKKDTIRPVEKRKFEVSDSDHSDTEIQPSLDGKEVKPISGKGGFHGLKKPRKDKLESKIEENGSGPVQLESVEEKKPTEVTGPLKAIPANIKTTTITDFQPDVCKDYLQTGYCGYGDTCKFLHVRDESFQKKAIVKEWQNVQQKKSTTDTSSTIPYRCVICKKDYTKPVKINCGHIFCQKCFLDTYKKKPNCKICGKDTQGTCMPILAKELEELIK